MGDINSSSGSIGGSADNNAPPVLKIKISKDKLEPYNSGSSTETAGGALGSAGSAQFAHGQNSNAGGYPTYGHLTNSSSHHSSSSSSSSKKKDRDREKDRDRKRNHDSSSSKSNASSVSGNLVQASATVTTSANGSVAGNHGSTHVTQKPQYSSKV